jgi:hypothetical protein
MTQVIPPQPSPETWNFNIVPMSDGTNVVCIGISGVSGTHVSFMQPDQADGLAEEIKKIARQARSGLITPPPNWTPPTHPNGLAST